MVTVVNFMAYVFTIVRYTIRQELGREGIRCGNSAGLLDESSWGWRVTGSFQMSPISFQPWTVLESPSEVPWNHLNG